MGPNRINSVFTGEKANHHFTEGEKKTGEHGPAMQVVIGLCSRRFRDGAASSMIEMALIFYKKFRSVPQALTLRTSGS